MYVGVDWGGTKIEAIALTETGAPSTGVGRTLRARTTTAVCKAIVDLVETIEAEVGRRERVGIGLPGSLDPRTGSAKGASSTWLNGRPVEDDLRAALRRRGPDEQRRGLLRGVRGRDGAGAGHRVVFAVILGTGAGAGIAVDGRAHHGPNNSAGEWGHNPLPLPDVTEIPGPACYCGKHGCLETWVSRPRVRPRLRAPRRASTSPSRSTSRRRRSSSGCAPATGWPRLVWQRYVDRVGRGLSRRGQRARPGRARHGRWHVERGRAVHRPAAVLARYTFSPVFYTPVVPGGARRLQRRPRRGAGCGSE